MCRFFATHDFDEMKNIETSVLEFVAVPKKRNIVRCIMHDDSNQIKTVHSWAKTIHSHQKRHIRLHNSTVKEKNTCTQSKSPKIKLRAFNKQQALHLPCLYIRFMFFGFLNLLGQQRTRPYNQMTLIPQGIFLSEYYNLFFTNCQTFILSNNFWASYTRYSLSKKSKRYIHEQKEKNTCTHIFAD